MGNPATKKRATAGARKPAKKAPRVTKAAKPAKEPKAKAAKKPAKEVKPTKSVAQASVLNDIADIESELTTAEREFETKKTATKAAKEKVEELRRELRNTIHDARNGQASLFNAVKHVVTGKGSASASFNGNGECTSTTVALTDESWKAVKIATLDLPKATIAKLAEANICTVGDYSDYLQPRGDNGWTKRLSEIPGIGKQAVTKIEDAMEKFFADHRAKVAQQPAETAEPTKGEAKDEAAEAAAESTETTASETAAASEA